MVDTLALGASGSNPMEVQVLSSAPITAENRLTTLDGFLFFSASNVAQIYFILRETRGAIISDPKK